MTNSKRRPKGSGGVYTYEISTGTKWYFKCTVVLANGHKKIVVRRGFGTEDAALVAMERLLNASREHQLDLSPLNSDKIANPRYIYALVDDSGRMRYVGQTANPAARLRQHWSTRYAEKRQYLSRKTAWLKSLTAVPEMKILEKVDEKYANDAEEKWIRYAIQRDGDAVLNSLLAGPWHPQVGESMRGAKRSEETRQRMSASQRQRYERERETGIQSRGRYARDRLGGAERITT